MAEKRVTRRTALKAGAGAGLLTSLTGCLDSGSGSGNGDGPSSGGGLDAVPSSTTAVVYLDTGRLLDGELVQQSVNRTLDLIQQQRSAALPVESYQEALSMAETEIGLDPQGLQSVQFFSDGSGSTAGLLFEADWSEDEIVSTIENQMEGALTSQTQDGHTIYADDSGEEGLVALADGRYLLGESATIDSVLAVLAGEADPVGGAVANAYDGTSGMMRFAADVRQADMGGGQELSAVEDAQTVSGSLTASGDTRTLTLDVSMPDAESATQMAEQADALLTLAEGRIDQYPEVQEYIENPREHLDAVEVSSSGSTVTVTYGGSVELVAEGGMLLLAAVVGSFVLGLGESTGTDYPQASFDWDYDSGPSANSLVITLQSVNQELAAASLSIRGSLGNGESIDQTWAALSDHDQSALVLAGDSVTLGEETLDGRPITDGWDLDIVWVAGDRSDSAVLSSASGPDA